MTMHTCERLVTEEGVATLWCGYGPDSGRHDAQRMSCTDEHDTPGLP
jgi:hypothetical protein